MPVMAVFAVRAPACSNKRRIEEVDCAGHVAAQRQIKVNPYTNPSRRQQRLVAFHRHYSSGAVSGGGRIVLDLAYFYFPLCLPLPPER